MRSQLKGTVLKLNSNLASVVVCYRSYSYPIQGYRLILDYAETTESTLMKVKMRK